MAELNKSWLPEIGNLEQQLLTQDQSDRSHANNVAAQAESNAKGYAANVAGQAETNAKGYAETVAGQAEASAKSYADTKKQEAISAAATDATIKAESVDSSQVNYVGIWASGEKTVYEYTQEHGKGVFSGYVRGENNQNYPVSYGATLTTVVAGDYGFEFLYDRLNVYDLYYRGGANGWGAFAKIYHTKNLTLPEDKDAGAVGSYGLLMHNGSVSNNVYHGQTVAGSELKWSSASGFREPTQQGSPEPVASGTWRCMGFKYGAGDAEQATTLWLRIS